MNDLTGMVFGNLTALHRVQDHCFPSGQRQVQYLCQCDCGNQVIVLGSNLKSGNTKSCGCVALKSRTKHSMYGTPIYKCWDNMRNRCLNPNATGYENWGGRGIKVCEAWANDFNTFYTYVSKLEHFGEPGRQLDRINNDGNYEPGNVRWATRREQTLNSRNCLK